MRPASQLPGRPSHVPLPISAQGRFQYADLNFAAPAVVNTFTSCMDPGFRVEGKRSHVKPPGRKFFNWLTFQVCELVWFLAGSKGMGVNMKLKLTEELWREGSMYVSYCPELDIASCGESVEQAKKNLKEVILINLEEAQKLGTLATLLQEAGFDETQDVLTLRKELVGFTPFELSL